MNKILENYKKYNQIAYVEYLLDNGYLLADQRGFYNNVKMLAAYLRTQKGMKPKAIENFVYDFVGKNDPYYNKAIDYARIDRALRDSKKTVLKAVESVKIFRTEFNYINDLPLDISRKKVLFSAYCFYKLRDGMYPNLKESPFVSCRLVSLSKLKSTSKSKDDIRYYFNELKGKYLDWIGTNKGSCIVLPFINSIPEIPDGDECCVIANFDNLYLYYDYFLGDKSIGFCKKCGAPFRDKNYKKPGARQIYCKDCSVGEKVNYKSFVCGKCGKPSEISTKAKRKMDLCDECYHIERNKDRHVTPVEKNNC